MKTKQITVIQFWTQVCSEIKKVVWPTRSDVVLTSCIVFVIAFIFSVFLMIVDRFVILGLQFILGGF